MSDHEHIHLSKKIGFFFDYSSKSKISLSQFEPFVLGEEFCDFGVYCLFGGGGWLLVAAFYEFFDLVLEDFGFCFGLFAFADLVFIVHRETLLQ